MLSKTSIARARERLYRKDAQRKDLLRQRLQRAQDDCRQIVEMIKTDFKPTRIYQWGSLVRTEHFSEISDIDIAVEGVTDAAEFSALYSRASDMTALPLDIVQLERVDPLHAQSIVTKGAMVYERR